MFASGPRRPRHCRRCGALVGSEEDACSACGAPDRPWTGWTVRLRDALGRLAVHRVILGAICLIYLGMVADQGGFTPEVDLAQLTDLAGGFRHDLIYRWGSQVTPALNDGQWWRLITSCFLHLSLLHVLMNGVALFFVGKIAEDRFGPARFLIIYLGAGLAGSLLSWAVGIDGAGASGAIFGLIGAGIAHARVSRLADPGLTARMVGWAIYAFVFGFFVGANNWAHGGGFIAGYALAWLVGPRRVRPYWHLRLLAGAAGLAAVAALAAAVPHVVYGPRAGDLDAFMRLVHSSLFRPAPDRRSARLARLEALPLFPGDGERIKRELARRLETGELDSGPAVQPRRLALWKRLEFWFYRYAGYF